jgi:hypothetical protein
MILTAVLLISCNKDEIQKPKLKVKVVLPDATTKSFDAGTIKLINYYVQEFDKWKTKHQISMAYKLYKTLSVFKNVEQNISLLTNAKDVRRIVDFNKHLLSLAIAFESKLTKEQKKQIFSANKNSLLVYTSIGFIHHDQVCRPYLGDKLKFNLEHLYKYRSHIQQFLVQSDIHYMNSYIENLVKILPVDQKKLKLYYLNLQQYYPKENIVKVKKMYEAIEKRFNEKTLGLISKPALREFSKQYGHCSWNNSKLFSKMILNEVTLRRGRWLAKEVLASSVELQDKEIISLKFKADKFPNDTILDAWNKFYRFQKKDGKRFVLSTGSSISDARDDLVIEIK